LIIFRAANLYSLSQVDSLLAFADHQYLTGDYESAVKEYLRIGYFQNFSDPLIQLRLANSYYMSGKWSTARFYYDQVYRLADPDSIKMVSKINKISTLVSEEKYKEGLIELFGINDSVYQKHYAEIDLLFGICYFGLEEFDKSRDYFKDAVKNNNSAQARIDSIFHNKKSFYRPKVAIPYLLSIILPGLGQIYLGEISEGLNSFFLTESLLILGAVVAYEYSVFDALLSVLPWYQRYYMGGLNNTWDLVIKKRQKRRSEAYKAVLDIVAAEHEQL
jgi:tetratricopeptide (TPR) repeat protein